MLKSELKKCIIDNGLGNLLLLDALTICVRDDHNSYLLSSNDNEGVYIAYNIDDDYVVLNKLNRESRGWEPDMFVPLENDAEIHKRIKNIAIRLKEINIKEKLKNINDDFVEI